MGMRVRFDFIGLTLAGDDMALVKHHINACEADGGCRYLGCPYVA